MLLIKKWFMATRPSSLVISGVPVVIGTAMAYGDGIAHFPTALVALLGAFMIHIGTNLMNDYGDLKKGADQIGHIDPMRGFAIGEITPRALLIAAIIAFVCAVPPSIYLILRGGWPIALIATISILVGILYTAGPYPLAYLGLGELLVLIFFGPVAVAGTYYVQSSEINLAVIMAGLAPGLLGVGVLTINNIRNLDVDRAVGKQTLAVRFGKTFAYNEYLFAIIGASLIPLSVTLITMFDRYNILWASAIAIIAIPTIVKIVTATEEKIFNQAIGETVRLVLIYCFLFSLGWIR